MPRPLQLVPPPRPPDAAPPRAPFEGDDAALVAAFRAGEPRARAALYERHADHVHRVLRRLLGFRGDLADLHHDVFVRALASLPNLADPSALKAWLTRIAVFVARSAIAKRVRGRWLWFLPGDEVPEVPASTAPREILDAVRATYAVLDQLPTDERIAFALRFIEGMELTEVAAATGTSLATAKRRIARAEERFERHARKEPALGHWLEGGSRWGGTNDR